MGTMGTMGTRIGYYGRIAALASLPIVTAVTAYVVSETEIQAAGLNATYNSSTDSCAAPVSDCTIIVVGNPPNVTKFASLSYITSHSESFLGQTAKRWVVR